MVSPQGLVQPVLVNGIEHVLVASCLGELTGGGLCMGGIGGMQVVDRLSSTGLFVKDGLVARALWTPSQMAEMAELLIYDHKGVLGYQRLDATADVHDVLLLDDGGCVVVSTGTNELIWYSEGGQVVKRWRAEGEGDSWHLNSLLQHAGELYACAFGKFQKHREWAQAKDSGSGCVIKISTGEVVLTGLMCPHNPRLSGDSWILCNSARGELVEVDAASQVITRSQSLGGWTRGLAFADEHVFVGVSANRQYRDPGVSASIAVLDRQSWQVTGRIELPFEEVYDLVLLPPEQVLGLQRGFATSPSRTAEQERYALFRQAGVEPTRLWPSGDPLASESCRIQVTAQVPEVMTIGTRVQIPCEVRNAGNAILATMPPCPVHISYKWLDPATGKRLADTEGLRTRLSRSLLPGEALTCQLVVQAPALEGEWIVAVTLVQEQVAWFDDLDPGSSFRKKVSVCLDSSRVD
ncbi:DUF4915 domain-containing protein [Verrucomicrobium spinosum]|uniref:DUF4915 domain-containing protein n=1 Tax=Verrucomicrobium spinosum TaxID=2736 RepID=UPI0009D6D9D5|nr:DUF4915 domain-containing protein [Verrucomicrobium spinosum]